MCSNHHHHTMKITARFRIHNKISQLSHGEMWLYSQEYSMNERADEQNVPRLCKILELWSRKFPNQFVLDKSTETKKTCIRLREWDTKIMAILNIKIRCQFAVISGWNRSNQSEEKKCCDQWPYLDTWKRTKSLEIYSMDVDNHTHLLILIDEQNK